MLDKFLKKSKEVNGSASNALTLVSLTLIFLCLTIMINSFNNDLFKRYHERCEWGIKSATKAALLFLNESDSSVENTGLGFSYALDKYNNKLKISYPDAIDTFFSKYALSTAFDENVLKNTTTIAIIEPMESDYSVYFYKNGVATTSTYSSLSDIQDAINNILSKVKINLGSTVDLETKTYFIAVTEDLKVDGTPININTYFFEGSNLVRNTNLRGE